METPLEVVFEGMEDGDLWRDAGIVSCIQYLAKSTTKLNVPASFARVYKNFLDKL